MLGLCNDQSGEITVVDNLNIFYFPTSNLLVR